MTPLRIGAMQLIAVMIRTETGFRSTNIIPGGFMPLRDDDADDNPIPTLKLTMTVPGQPEMDATVQGPGLAHLTRTATRNLPGLLLSDPDIQAVSPMPAWPLIWRLVLAANPAHQIAVYNNRPGIRVGLIDATSGGCALLCANRQGTDWAVDTIEGYGVHATLTRELISHVDNARTTPERLLQDIAITVAYDRESVAPNATVRTIKATDHDIHIGWKTVPGDNSTSE